MEDIKNKILEEYNKGNIVIATPMGIQTAKLSDFIEQDIEGILYDLNRSEIVALTFIGDPKWINDYAVAKTIRALKSRIAELEKYVAKN